MNVVVAVAASFVPESWMTERRVVLPESPGKVYFIRGFASAREMEYSWLPYPPSVIRKMEIAGHALPAWSRGDLGRYVPERDLITLTGTTEYGRGWPFVSFWGARLEAWDGFGAATELQRVGCVPVTIGPTAHVIAYTPETPGIVLNTLVWGAITLSLAESWRALKRSRRAKRGRCVACGYELGELERCPECGLEQ